MHQSPIESQIENTESKHDQSDSQPKESQPFLPVPQNEVDAYATVLRWFAEMGC